MTCSRRLYSFILCLILPLHFLQALSPENVVIVASKDDPKSVELAEFYAEQRSIPKENILLLSVPDVETINWSQYVSQIHNPLLQLLLDKNWINALPDSGQDKAGRNRIVLLGHKIDALVLCKGIPLRISHSDELLATNPAPVQKEFEKNYASVDSEIAALPQSDQPTSGFVQNSLYGKASPGSIDSMRIIRVTRLDGPSYEDAKALVTNALKAEEKGLLGRAYVDIRGPHQQGNDWLKQVAEDLSTAGYDPTLYDERGTFPAATRFDAPVLYFGWYARNLNGPFALPGFRFPTGAIAMHIHSFSATTLHSDRKDWVGPLVARGVTATVGNVYEPYLQLTHNPVILFRSLASGLTFGEAAYISVPAVSWQAIAVGDPLYRPFKVTPEQQLSSLQRGEINVDMQYAVIRAMNLMKRQGRTNEALQLGRSAMTQTPGYSLLLKIAEMELEQGRKDAAVTALKPVAQTDKFTVQDWFLAAEIADLLINNGDSSSGLQVYETLINDSGLPRRAKISMLERAVAISGTAGEGVHHEKWRAELNRLNPPEEKSAEKGQENAG